MSAQLLNVEQMLKAYVSVKLEKCDGSTQSFVDRHKTESGPTLLS